MKSATSMGSVPGGVLRGSSGSPPRRSRRSVGRASATIGLALALFTVGGLGLIHVSPDPSTTPLTRGSATLSALAGTGLSDGIADLQERVRLAPEDWRSQAVLGLAYVQEARITADPGLYPRAEESLRRSLALKPTENFEALVGRGALALARHDFAGGLRWGRQARQLNPYNVNVYGIIGDAQLELGRYRAAFATMQRMIDLKPNVASYARASYVRQLQGDVPGAIAAMKLALEAAGSPEDRAFAAHQLGELFVESGRLTEATPWFLHARELAPSFSPPLEGLAHVAAAEGRRGDAIRLLRTIVARSPLPEYATALGDLYAQAGRGAEASRQYELVRVGEDLLRAAGANVDLEVAVFDADHRRPRRALTAARAEWRRRHSIEVADALAWALYRNDRLEEAARYSDFALRLGFPNALFHFHAGMIDLGLGRTRSARHELQTALEINPYFSVQYSRVAARVLQRL